jgi:hypothetical protein
MKIARLQNVEDGCDTRSRWNEPVSGRELHALEGSGFHGALFRQLRATTPPCSPHVPTPKSSDATSAGSTKFRSKEPQRRSRQQTKGSPGSQ